MIPKSVQRFSEKIMLKQERADLIFLPALPRVIGTGACHRGMRASELRHSLPNRAARPRQS
jgi:hypothetical protein